MTLIVDLVFFSFSPNEASNGKHLRGYCHFREGGNPLKQ